VTQDLLIPKSIFNLVLRTTTVLCQGTVPSFKSSQSGFCFIVQTYTPTHIPTYAPSTKWSQYLRHHTISSAWIIIV